MRRFLQYLAVFFLGFLIFPQSALSSGLPRFDGVYIETKDRRFIQLQRFQMQNRKICQGRGLSARSFGRLSVPPGSAIRAAPEVEFGDIESIFIRSRTERLMIVLDAVEFSDATSGMPRRPDMNIASPQFSGWEADCMSAQRSAVNWNDRSLVSSGCGFLAERFNVLNESATTWQYFERSEFSFGNRQGNRLNDCGARRSDIQPRGIFIRTNEGYYFVGLKEA